MENEPIEGEYWSRSHYEGKIANKIGECFDLGINAYNSDYERLKFIRAVDLLVKICPINVKEKCLTFKIKMENSAPPESDPTDDIDLYQHQSELEINKTDVYLGYIVDRCEEAGLTVKPKKRVRQGGDKLAPSILL